LLAQLIDDFPREVRVYARSTHIIMGVGLVLILAARLFWRNTGGRQLPAAKQGPLNLLAKGTHYLLYAIVLMTLACGIGYTFLRGDNILNLFRLPKLFADVADLRDNMGDLHALGANSLMILAGIHAAAALFHHYVWKDGVLRRMLPARG